MTVEFDAMTSSAYEAAHRPRPRNSDSVSKFFSVSLVVLTLGMVAGLFRLAFAYVPHGEPNMLLRSVDHEGHRYVLVTDGTKGGVALVHSAACPCVQR